MFDKFLDSTVHFAAKSFSAVNALHFGVMKKIGLLHEFRTSFTEVQGSDEDYNVRLDNDKNVQFQFSLNAEASIDGFFDPLNTEHFMQYHFAGGSYVTLPGIAENAEIRNGRMEIKSVDTVEYRFEFEGKDGLEYVYIGSKKFSIFNPVESWFNLKGVVFEKETGKQVLDSITFFGNGDLSSSILPFLGSIRLD